VGGTLIFDGNCGFCTRSRNLLARLDRHDRVSTVPFQRQGVAERAGVSRDELAAAVYWLDENGARYSGAHAANAALSAAVGTSLPLRVYRMPGMRQLQDAVYRWVAANRHRLPGTRPWCQSHPHGCR
jgi:predicted DCC family thiol-disulfide oxidoreductase YuxK